MKNYRKRHFDDLIEGDFIIIDLRLFKQGFVKLEVEEINYAEECVRCKDNYMDFYPDEEGYFLIPN